MQISFEKFLSLTVTLATGASMSLGCVVETTGDDSGSGGGSSSARTDGDAGSESDDSGSAGAAGAEEAGGAAGSAGQSITDAGTAGTAGEQAAGGAAGSAAGSSSEGGFAGSAAGSSSEGGSAGSAAGSSPEEGGAAGSSAEGGSAGNAAGSTSEGGTGGSAGSPSTEGGTGGSAGSPSTEGTGGGTSADCVSGDPAEEGAGYDCSGLSYIDETCANPTAEGSALPARGVEVCWQHADKRSGPVQVLTECLALIDNSAEGYCGEEHASAVDACVQEMQARTCATTAAEQACADIAGGCAGVAEETCVAQLSAMDDTQVTDVVLPCAMTATSAGVCDYQFRSCLGDGGGVIEVVDACAAVLDGCPAVDGPQCQTRLDIYGAGVLYESTHYGLVVSCMETEENGGAECGAAYETCTSTWAS